MLSTDYGIKYFEIYITVTEIYKTDFSQHTTCVGKVNLKIAVAKIDLIVTNAATQRCVVLTHLQHKDV